MKAIFLLLLFVSICFGQFHVISPSDLATGPIPTGDLQYGPTSYNITGKLVIADPFEGCVFPYKNQAEVYGNIVLVHEDLCYPYEKAQYAYDNGAIAVILVSGFDGSLGIMAYYNNYGPRPYIPIPAIQILPTPVKALVDTLKSGKNITIIGTFTNEINPWQAFIDTGAWIAFGVIFQIYCVITFALALWKFIKFVKSEGPQFSVPQVCLVVGMIVSVERFILMIDPLFTKKIYAFPTASVLLSLSFPISLISNLFITFYWHEKMAQTKTVVLKHLEKARIPFGIIVAIMLILEISSSTLRGYWFYNNAIQTLNGGLYAVITAAIAIFFEIIGIRILIRLSKGAAAKGKAGKGGKRKIFLNKITLLLMASGFCMIGFIIGVIIIASPAYSTPPVIYVAWIIVFASMQSISLTHILVFIPPNEEPSKRSSEGSADSDEKKRKSNQTPQSGDELIEHKPEKGLTNLP